MGAYLRLSSDRPIGEPFVDMILETSWNSGRIVRDYTMLFDPPAPAQAGRWCTGGRTTAWPSSAQNVFLPPPGPPQLQLAAAPAVSPTVTTPSQPTPPRPAATATKPVVMSQHLWRQQYKRPPLPRPPSRSSQADTASAIAAAHKSANVSLDQMLVALLRTNPEAFHPGQRQPHQRRARL